MTAEQKQERPAAEALVRRRLQPAPDEASDPIPIEAEKKKPARSRKVVASTKVEAVLDLPALKPQPVAVFPFSTRLSQEVMDILKTITDRGVSQRAAVEHAIKTTYGQASK